jgi:hypothetical protein
MFRSFFPNLAPKLALPIALTLSVLGCSTQPKKPALPAVTVRTATMNITPGIEVLTHVALPDGFVPSTEYPPMWLQSGQEVAIVGTLDGRAVVMGYSGSGYRTPRIIAQDRGLGAPEGRILDLAAGPDGLVLALAVMDEKQQRLEVITRDVISAGAANPVSSFDGDFDSVSVGWLGDFTIPIALRTHANANDEASRDQLGFVSPDANSSASGASSGLYTINVIGAVTTGFLKLNCKMSRLSWSPQGIVAVGAGDANAPPIIIDRDKESCERLNAKEPIRVLDWQPDSKAFLYEETNGAVGTGTYRFDLSAMRARLVAISSGAATFVGNDQILALGNGALTFREAQVAPERAIRAELALSNAAGTETEVESLGFNTTPAMLATSTMTFSRETDSAAIATFSPSSEGPIRKLVIYSIAPKRALLVAFGPVRGGVSMSWSPRGRYLAIADGDITSAALTIMAPPQ